MSDSPASDSSAMPLQSQDLVAKAGAYYRNARYIVVAVTLCVGFWFAYDGWVKWPSENARFDTMTEHAGQAERHPEFSLNLQRYIAVGLVAIAFPMLGWFLYRSRGAYCLSGKILHVPGHPPVPLEAIISIDKSNWERKGIAYIDYQLEERGDMSRLALDDFIYQREPTDQIVARIEAWLKAEEEAETDSAQDEEAST